MRFVDPGGCHGDGGERSCSEVPYTLLTGLNRPDPHSQPIPIETPLHAPARPFFQPGCSRRSSALSVAVIFIQHLPSRIRLQWPPRRGKPMPTRSWRNWAVRRAQRLEMKADANMGAGGSFGSVYKAIDRNTSETVAIKHVRSGSRNSITCRLTSTRSTSRQQTTSSRISKLRSACSGHAAALTLPNTKRAS